MTAVGDTPPSKRSQGRGALPPAPVWVRCAAQILRRLPAGRYRASQVLARVGAAPFAMRMPASLGGHRFRVELEDCIARDVCFLGTYEPQETALLRRLLRPGMTFVDVGANWGYFTLLGAHQVGAAGRVVGIEPHPQLFSILRENLELNHLAQVTSVQVAAAAGPGTLRLAGYEPGDAGGNRGISRLVDAPGEAATTFDVQAAALDTLLDDQGVGTVDLVKMDIEGAELLALEGMRAGLRARRYRTILLELHPAILAERGASVGAVIDLLTQAGYRGWAIDHSAASVRRASYAASLDPAAYLQPIEQLQRAAEWPHTLWTAPGVAW